MKKFFLVLTALAVLFVSCPDSGGSSSNNNPVDPNNPVEPARKTLVVFDNTYGICTALVYSDYRRRSEDKIAEVQAGRRSNEIEWFPSASEPFYFAYLISLNGVSDFTMNYVPKNGKDQKAVRIDANVKTNVIIPKLDETFSSADQLLSSRSSLLLKNESAYSFELHRGRTSVQPDNKSGSPVVNSQEKAFYTINTSDTFDPSAGTVANYHLLAGADYKEFPTSPNRFEPGHFYSYTYNGAVSSDSEIPIKIENIIVNEYAVTFNANGGSGTAPATQTAKAGSVIRLPNGNGLSKNGYTFGGWNLAASGAEINYSAGADYLATGDITLYAKWHPLGTVTYSVSFNSNGGNTTASQNVVSGAAAFLPVNPIRNGYEFVDWYSDSALTKVYDFSSRITDNITLYAKWNAISQYTVTFNTNGAIGEGPSAQTVNSGSSVTLPGGSGLSKTGHAFGGWSTDDTGAEDTYNAGASYTVSGDITLFAKWNPFSYTVAFNSTGGSAVPNQTVYYGSVADRPEDPVKAGFTFDNWYGDSGLTSEYDFTSSVTGNKTLYAKWTPTDTVIIIDLEMSEQSVSVDVNTDQLFSVTGIYSAYEWYLNGMYDGADSTYLFNQSYGVYELNVRVTDSAGEKRSGRCRVTVNSIVTLSAIAGITAPATGIAPATVITETAQYSGTVSWSPSVIGIFARGTQYTAIITLTVKSGYTLQGVAENSFTVVGATAVSNAANSGVITAVFPATAIYALGDTGPGGGRIFYYSAAGFTMTDTGETCHYLEAAPNNIPTGISWFGFAWSSQVFNIDIDVQYRSTDISGTGTAIGTGRKNTALILAKDSVAPAAKECRDYRGTNNLTDWFLPSKDELNALYNNRSYVGNMGTSSFWSSSQSNGNDNGYKNFAWMQQFSDGRQSETLKYGISSVRAIRAF